MSFWSELGESIIKIGAPLLGTAIGGPFGGSIAAIVAEKFGVNSNVPDEIKKAIQADPEAAIKLKQIESEERVRLKELAFKLAMAEVEQVNKTMRAESQSEKWPQYSWRPFCGFVYGLSFLVVTVFVCILAYNGIVGGKVEALNMIPQFVGGVTALFGVVMPILGIASHHRG